MRLRRCFVEEDSLAAGEHLLAGRTARYLSRVLRLQPGQRLVLFDGSGREFPAEILDIRKKQVRVRLEEGVWVDRESPLALWLVLGISRPATMDLAMQKATELGATGIAPAATARSQNWLPGGGKMSRTSRWQRIAAQAARQCGRNRVPEILPPASFTAALERFDDSWFKLIFWEHEVEQGLKEMLRTAGKVRQVCACIGPEGGFTGEEIEEAASRGFQQASLGRRILRTETAVITVLSLLQYEMGDMGF
ncbi:MAG: 16S rRNA (uracil(1498)-N(3))-methyltransferase [Deltaproteobacteria bacterium]|nr:16S rRNA (uracil(1498)-N(3))-methyltransferase [Deltaproteobacteria bacterium]MBW2071977.1 16S rRNA (uracil(1498)-N(3))-methyltransferase [Deltaproteobacteria bacterium]